MHFEQFNLILKLKVEAKTKCQREKNHWLRNTGFLDVIPRCRRNLEISDVILRFRRNLDFLDVIPRFRRNLAFQTLFRCSDEIY